MKMPVIIAHRGASGYLPEHTLPAKALAYAMGADFLEQDVVASADDELIVLHDIYLDRVSDVAERYPTRHRQDGRFYVRDFNLTELRSLRAWERMDADGRAVYPGRYPARHGEFRIHTLREELDLVQQLNAATNGRTGVYPEIKRPKWHREEGVDITPSLLQLLSEFGYTGRDDALYLQCFDASELRRIRYAYKSSLKLVQLIGENDWGESDTDYDVLRSAAGIRELARTVDAIGPWVQQLYELDDCGAKTPTGLLRAANASGLAVHPYTFREDELAAGFDSLADQVRYFTIDQPVDGIFTDFPDKVRFLIS